MYREGYRAEDFRGKTIKQAFDEIMNLGGKSENFYRIYWLQHKLRPKFGTGYLLDIGSGFGIFPNEMKNFGYDVTCIEPNEDSRNFIENELEIDCYDKFDPGIHIASDIVSIIHVLEHMQDPEVFLYEARKALVSRGVLFIEVPDSVEFNYLPKDSDEFNSLHLHFFNVANLYNLVERCGFNVTDIHRVHYTERDLRRILLLV
jgi:SAM-dependent methyltransferase